jgi:hypothetical protein
MCYIIRQCCGPGMFIPDPESLFLPIPDPGTKNRNKREGWQKICRHTFFCSHKFHKIVNYFILEMLKKKIWANFQRIIEFFTPKNVTKLSKIWVWEPGSGIRDPGSGKNQFQIPDPDPQHCQQTCNCKTICKGRDLLQRAVNHLPYFHRVKNLKYPQEDFFLCTVFNTASSAAPVAISALAVRRTNY